MIIFIDFRLDGVNFNDNENIQTLNNCELVETNKNLSLSLEKSENRARELQEKLSHNKIFKKIVNNASSVQCLHCGQNILIGVFASHLLSCAKIDLSGYGKNLMGSAMNNNGGYGSSSGKFTVAGPVKELNSISYSTPLKQILNPGPSQSENDNKSEPTKDKTKKSAENSKKTKEKPPKSQEKQENNQEAEDNEERSLKSNGKDSSPTDFAVNIAQTLIKEGSDHKPFIEYLIYCKKGQQKWLVSRKYKNFCELHQLLLGMFPGYPFPSSSKALINSFNDFNTLQDLRKPKIVDERKLMLESYLQELVRSPEICGCLPFKQFVGVEGKNGKQFSNDFLDLDNPDESTLYHFKNNI